MAKVLIVEDEPDVAALMAQRLRSYYDVCFAGDGIAAIATAPRAALRSAGRTRCMSRASR